MGRCFAEGSENGSLTRAFDVEEFRENAHRMVDFIADYYRDIHKFPVRSQVQPGYLQTLIPDNAPEYPETLEDVLTDVQNKIIPGITHWQSPNFFSFYPSNSSTAGLLGEMLSGGFNIVGFSWITSPAATELEAIVLNWLGKMLKLPEPFLLPGKGGGVIQGTASEAVLVVLLAARDRVLKGDSTKSLEKLVVYASDQAHSAVQKACMIAGISESNFRALPTNSSTNYALSPNILQKAILDDIHAGFCPLFLCATVGTTSSSAVDSLKELGKIAQDNGMWFHVDAAYAGSACICPEYQHYLDGVDAADSFNMNCHKWLLTNFDCSALWVKDSSALIDALSTKPEFLRNKIITPRTFSLVCFRLLPRANDPNDGFTLNSQLLDALNSSGHIYLSHTVLSGIYTLRFCVGAPLSEEQHVNAAWKIIQNKASILLQSCT